ncbi:MAG: DUF1934 domain-containing protein [Schwartzia sp.]|nr:DUF1934 domain-containing protein [Schwartzia sp. (in: firmicutes)]
MDRVIVRVRGEQTDTEGETSRIEMVAEGRHYYKAGKHYVLYDDQMLDTGEVSTVLKIEPDAMVLLRSGVVCQEQRFAINEESVSDYRTPFGDMRMAVRTEKLDVAYGSVTGNIDVIYAMSINGQVQSQNELHIEVTIPEGEAHRLN